MAFSTNESRLDDLLETVRGYRRRAGLSVRALAEMAGISDVPLRGIDGPDWSPSVATLRALMRAMDGPQARLLEVGRGIDRLSYGVRPFRAPEGRLLERILRPEALAALGRTDLLGSLRRLDGGGLDAEDAVEAARGMVAGSAVHLIDVSSPEPRLFRFRHWDPSTGYRGGEDFRGTVLADVDDGAYRAELLEAYEAVKLSGRPRVSFVHRRGPDGVRTFYRCLIRFVSHGGAAQIVSVTLPEIAQAARHLLPNRMRV